MPKPARRIKPDGYIVQEEIEKALGELVGIDREVKRLKELMPTWGRNDIKAAWYKIHVALQQVHIHLLNAQVPIKEKRRGDTPGDRDAKDD